MDRYGFDWEAWASPHTLQPFPPRTRPTASLQQLHLVRCSSLRALPDLLGCASLQYLFLEDCSSLRAMPDLSSLAQLEVRYLPKKLRRWEANGRKAYTVPRAGCCLLM